MPRVGELLLSVDFEDWHQLVRRRVGDRDWQRPEPALARQTDALLALLDELGVRATFFVLGIAARSYPQLVCAIAQRGHEIACHGDQHRPVHSQTPDEFAADLRAARATIEQLTGSVPVGYRAPAFSITVAARWAYAVLADEGFLYDSSQHDSPRIRARVVPASAQPHALALDDGRALWEFPIAVWRPCRARSPGAAARGSADDARPRAATACVPARPRAARACVPVGGASYWGLLPTAAVLHGLARAGDMAGLYLHPHELDPQPLRARPGAGVRARQRAHALLRGAQRNVARRRAPEVLRAIASGHRLITYGEAHAQLSGRAGART
jgi:Polysaccharide deacetylase